MFGFDLEAWMFVGIPAALIVAMLVLLKVSYVAKGFSPLPENKPGFCLLPKYEISLQLDEVNLESELAARLEQCGLREVGHRGNAIKFTRGSALGDFSIKIAKLDVAVPLPVANPIQLQIQYGVAFGCAFDTGDLWKFCRELREKIEANEERAKSR